MLRRSRLSQATCGSRQGTGHGRVRAGPPPAPAGVLLCPGGDGDEGSDSGDGGGAEGARKGVRPATLSSIEGAALRSAAGLDPEKLKVDVSSGPRRRGEWIRVEVEYEVPVAIPAVSRFFPAVTVSGSAEMRIRARPGGHVRLGLPGDERAGATVVAAALMLVMLLVGVVLHDVAALYGARGKAQTAADAAAKAAGLELPRISGSGTKFRRGGAAVRDAQRLPISSSARMAQGIAISVVTVRVSRRVIFWSWETGKRSSRRPPLLPSTHAPPNSPMTLQSVPRRSQPGPAPP